MSICYPYNARLDGALHFIFCTSHFSLQSGDLFLYLNLPIENYWTREPYPHFLLSAILVPFTEIHFLLNVCKKKPTTKTNNFHLKERRKTETRTPLMAASRHLHTPGTLHCTSMHHIVLDKYFCAKFNIESFFFHYN